MSDHMPHPAQAPRFMLQASESNPRLFLATQCLDTTHSSELQAVATIREGVEVARLLCRVLNDAVEQNTPSVAQPQLSQLPTAVALSCRQALDRALQAVDDLDPDPGGLDIVLRTYQEELPEPFRQFTFAARDPEIARMVKSAMDVDLLVRVENVGRDDGYHCDVNVDMFDADVVAPDTFEKFPDEVGSWWPAAPGFTLAARLTADDCTLENALSDPRWTSHKCRMYWLWVRTDEAEDGSYSSSAEWFVEFFQEPVNPHFAFKVFVADDGEDEEARGALSPRNRFLLWQSLGNIVADLDGYKGPNAELSQIREDMPPLVSNESEEWWAQMCRSADRLCEAARTGDLSALVPRTPAEEALLYLATGADYIEWAEDSRTESEFQWVYDLLPTHDADGDFGWVQDELTSDADIAWMWMTDQTGPHPGHADNAEQLGKGSYRSSNWHRLFDGVVGDLPVPEVSS